MPANWSFILNVLLLLCVVVAIVGITKRRRNKMATSAVVAPSLGKQPAKYGDEIIAVRQIHTSEVVETSIEKHPHINAQPETAPHLATGRSVMMCLLAKDNKMLAGYELLQTILAAGLRFGDGGLFHRHQYASGQGPVLCSLAAATETGMFDLQHIGAFKVKGLCLFMQACGNPTIDAERFAIMLETAKQLSEDLNTHLLDENQRPLTPARLSAYYNTLMIAPPSEEMVELA